MPNAALCCLLLIFNDIKFHLCYTISTVACHGHSSRSADLPKAAQEVIPAPPFVILRSVFQRQLIVVVGRHSWVAVYPSVAIPTDCNRCYTWPIHTSRPKKICAMMAFFRNTGTAGFTSLTFVVGVFECHRPNDMPPDVGFKIGAVALPIRRRIAN
jgi:hypothetical protein